MCVYLPLVFKMRLIVCRVEQDKLRAGFFFLLIASRSKKELELKRLQFGKSL